MKRSSYIKYLASLLIFGTNGVVVSFIPLGSAEVVWWRTALGSVFLALVLLCTRQRLHLQAMRAQWARILVSGAVMGLSWVFLFEAYRLSGVGSSTLVYYFGPVLVMALSPLLFREKLTPGPVLGILAAVAGMVCVNARQVAADGISPGLLYALGSAVLYAALIIVNKRIEGLSGAELTLLQLLVACAVVTPYALLSPAASAPMDAKAWAALLLLGAVNSGLACYLYFSSIHELPAQTVAICSYLDPASALLFSAVFLSERLSALQLLGALLILGGAAAGELTRRRTPRVREEASA